MNFVETESPMLIASAAQGRMQESTESTPAVKAKSTGGRAFFAGMILSLMVFPFTLAGMMSATNWIVDQYVIPKVTARAQEWSKPLPGYDAMSAESSSADAAASIR